MILNTRSPDMVKLLVGAARQESGISHRDTVLIMIAVYHPGPHLIQGEATAVQLLMKGMFIMMPPGSDSHQPRLKRAFDCACARVSGCASGCAVDCALNCAGDLEFLALWAS